jgi:hypothetical protein
VPPLETGAAATTERLAAVAEGGQGSRSARGGTGVSPMTLESSDAGVGVLAVVSTIKIYGVVTKLTNIYNIK